MSRPRMTRQEYTRLETVFAVLGSEYPQSIKALFNAAGSPKALSTTKTPEESAEIAKALATSRSSLSADSAVLSGLKISDIYLQIARRAAGSHNISDKNLADAISLKGLGKDDVAVLRKYDLKSLAAVVEASL